MAKLKVNIDDIVRIVWVDTMAWAGWHDQEQIKGYGLLPITSVGIVVADKKIVFCLQLVLAVTVCMSK